MAARTKARKRALDVLFEADQRHANVSQVLDERLVDSGMPTPLPPYTVELVRGTVSEWPRINQLIEQSSLEWTIDRMPAVDRALLRIATWEIIANPGVPHAVAINEAVALATELSTDDSGRFINGVLAAIAARVAVQDPAKPVE